MLGIIDLVRLLQIIGEKHYIWETNLPPSRDDVCKVWEFTFPIKYKKLLSKLEIIEQDADRVSVLYEPICKIPSISRFKNYTIEDYQGLHTLRCKDCGDAIYYDYSDCL